jgi:hypothetical protein
MDHERADEFLKLSGSPTTFMRTTRWGYRYDQAWQLVEHRHGPDPIAVLRRWRALSGGARCRTRLSRFPPMGERVDAFSRIDPRRTLAACSRPDKSLTIAVNAGVEGSALKAAALNGNAAAGPHRVVELPYANLFEKESLDLRASLARTTSSCSMIRGFPSWLKYG